SRGLVLRLDSPAPARYPRLSNRPPPTRTGAAPMDSPINRRRFLQAGAAVAATAGVTGLPALAEAAADSRNKKQDNDPFGGFTVGVQSYTFRQFKLEQCLVQTQKLGLRHIEFYNGHVPLNSTAAQIKAVLNLCREHQVTPVAFGVE